ncbi:MAG: terminase family protein [Patescibacteria group bacterium]|nr:terminase family protein [Patescibacteria group bacterium]
MAAAALTTRSVDYVPRAQFVDFHNRSKRWAVIVAHRRAGKTVACVMELLTRALATSKQDARYAYIAPYREQAKSIAWNYLKHYATPIVRDPEADFRESELAVRLFNGSIVRLFGADNPNALRGMYLDGVVLDEYADMRPSLWGEVIRPTLSDRKGWAVFIGTPRGKNEFWEIYRNAATLPDWLQLTLPVSQTKLLDDAELADAKRTMTQAQYEQEYECSFEAAILGAVYAKELATAKIKPTPYDPALIVHTAWDIGYGDSTSIWFYQIANGLVRIIDFYEDSGEAAPFYASVLQRKGYNYGTCWLPHDANNGQSATGISFIEVIRQNGFRAEIVKKLSLEEGINAARMAFPRMTFDGEKCERGLEALRAYRWAYNERMGEIKPTPVHNWASHAADAFRYLAIACRLDDPEYGGMELPALNYPKTGIV